MKRVSVSVWNHPLIFSEGTSMRPHDFHFVSSSQGTEGHGLAAITLNWRCGGRVELWSRGSSALK